MVRDLRGRGWEAVMRKSGTDLWMALWQRAHTRKILLCHVNIHQRSLVVVHWTKLYTCQLLIFPSYFLTRSVGTGTKRPWCQVWKLFFGSKLGLSLTKSELLNCFSWVSTKPILNPWQNTISQHEEAAWLHWAFSRMRGQRIVLTETHT